VKAIVLAAMSGLMLGLLGGCATDQAGDVALYRAEMDIGEPPSERPPKTLSLVEAIRFTNWFNENLSIEGENYIQALAERQRNAASLFPTFDLFGTLTFRDDGGSGDNGGSSSGTTLFDGGIGGQYTLLTGLSDFNRVEADRLTIEERWWLLLDLRETMLLETARAYYAVMLAERLVGVLESSLAVQDERLRDAKGREEVGFARPLDVAQISAQVSVTRVSLLDARNLVSVSRSALTFLTSIDASAVRLTDSFALPEQVPSRDELLSIAYQRRQDLAAAALAASAARAEVDAEIGRYFPTVTLNLDYFLTRDTVPTEREWTGLLTLNLPLFTAGRIEADVRAAWSAFRQDVLRYSLTRRGVQRDVEVTQSDLVVTGERIIELGNQIRAAEESLRQAEAAYTAGLGTNLDRIAAQDALLSAQLQLAREDYSLKIAYLAAMRAAGALTDAVVGRVPPSAPLPVPPESPFVVAPDAGRVKEGSNAEAR